MGGDKDNLTASGSQCDGRSSQPAGSAVPDESHAPALSLLNPFALSFAPQTTSIQSDAVSETGETGVSAEEPIAGSAQSGAEVLTDLASAQAAPEERSPELRRSTRAIVPPNRYSP